MGGPETGLPSSGRGLLSGLPTTGTSSLKGSAGFPFRTDLATLSGEADGR
jgi:hypothetical protein